MGCGQSNAAYAAESGTESDYKAAFDEKQVLGQGEFGVVKLIVKKNSPNSEPLAVKVLNKGFVFKDNTLYTPMKPGVLKAEVDILQELGGKKFNLALDSVYESSSKVYVVTEMCAGGELLEYTSKNMAEGLRTEDVSRIAYQLLSAVDHCDRHNVLHRDIKPENIMFKANTKTAELRLIDFGCGAMDNETGKEHVTFAGTPFYISPEMFQKKYTSKTDVFSLGVLLYVLVAGYPAECLQRAFNLLHKAKRDLRTLPGMPEDMPDTYYGMLDQMLTYRWKERKSAGELLDDEFVIFHQALEGKDSVRRMSENRTQSVRLSGTGEKAAAAFGFIKFQRSVTTILAALMDRGDVVSLVSFAEASVSSDDSLDPGLDGKLGVINVKHLKSILEAMGKSDCVMAIEKQKNAHTYDNYAYEYTMLKPFTQKHDDTDADYLGSSTRSVKASASSKLNPIASKALCSSERVIRSSRMNTKKSQSVFIRGI